MDKQEFEQVIDERVGEAIDERIGPLTHAVEQLAKHVGGPPSIKPLKQLDYDDEAQRIADTIDDAVDAALERRIPGWRKTNDQPNRAT